MVGVGYGSNTYRSKNPLRRFSHGMRFNIARDLVANATSRGAPILDYGAGDGRFLSVLEDAGFEDVSGYDPKGTDHRITADLSRFEPHSFGCITCLEVLEHITEEMQNAFFVDARRLLRPGGAVVISVPVMVGLSGTAKVALELVGSKIGPSYSLTNLVKCLIGKPPAIRDTDPQYSSVHYLHMGFDHRPIRSKLAALFERVTESTSPFAGLPTWMNSQVFWVCRGIRQ